MELWTMSGFFSEDLAEALGHLQSPTELVQVLTEVAAQQGLLQNLPLLEQVKQNLSKSDGLKMWLLVTAFFQIDKKSLLLSALKTQVHDIFDSK